MLEKFRSSKCYKYCALSGLFYILAMILLFIYEAIFSDGMLAILMYMFLVLIFSLGFIMIFPILTGIAIYQAKKGKGLNSNPVLFYDINYVLSFIIFIFTILLAQYIYRLFY